MDGPQATGGRRGSPLRAPLMALLLLAAAGAVLGPFYVLGRQRARASTCRSNLKSSANAILMYARDFNDRLPPAPRWRDYVVDYLPSEREFHCPMEVPGLQGGYALNARLSRRVVREFQDPWRVVSLFDSASSDRNTANTGTTIPDPPRHGGNCFAFLDGHVESPAHLPPDAWGPPPSAPASRRRGP